MLFNPLYLLLSSAWLVGISKSSKGPIDCTDMKAEVKKVEYWNCKTDGGAECRLRIEDCSACIDDGGVEQGTAYYDSDGQSYAVGGGWDCRSKCEGRQGKSGSQQWITIHRQNCYN
eukprot:GFUD01003206.1.p1 GENE.GFUD01003206.1~~GFUD01003206.1.p1  ORF type:complete len:116 (+),score=19.39 GFUD01003206.1:460-807(+)